MKNRKRTEDVIVGLSTVFAFITIFVLIVPLCLVAGVRGGARVAWELAHGL